ncbi:MAG: Zn-ribbon domain-containing OB-fold protein [Bacillota bacterium]
MESCPRCLSEEMAELPLNLHGILYSYAVVHQAPAGFRVPYAIGYVDLPEGVRVFAQLEGEFATLKPGLAVEAVTGVLRLDPTGNQVWGYKFRPVNDEGGA